MSSPSKSPSKVARHSDATPSTAPSDWLTAVSIGGYHFSPLKLKNTSQFARKVNNKQGTEGSELYLSQTVQIFKSVNDQLEPTSVLPVRGVRLIHQGATGGSRYGKAYVRMTLPTAFVEEVAERCRHWGTHIDPEQAVKEQTIVRVGGDSWSVFNADLKKADSYWVKDDKHVEVKLGPTIKKQGKDLVADVEFKVCLKYKGPHVDEPALAPMSIAFEPTAVYVTGVAEGALDPPPAPKNRPQPFSEFDFEDLEVCGYEGY